MFGNAKGGSEGVGMKTIEELEFELEALKAKHLKLRQAAEALRTAQRNYMANRGNQEFGKIVAVTGKELDRVLGETR